VAKDAFGGKRNRSERILDFVGDAPRHFPPRSLLLRFEQFREIFKNQHVPHALSVLLQGSDSNGDVNGRVPDCHFQLGRRGAEAVGSSNQRFEVSENFRAKDIAQISSDQDLSGAGFGISGLEQAKKSIVDVRDAAIGGER